MAEPGLEQRERAAPPTQEEAGPAAPLAVGTTVTDDGPQEPPPPAEAPPPPALPTAAGTAAAPRLLLQHPSWLAALQEPADLVPALRAEGALLCAELCERGGVAARRASGDGGVGDCERAWAEAASLGKELEAVAWEALHSGQAWRDVSDATRRAYAQAQFVLGAHDLQLGRPRECLRRLDMALLMGSPAVHGVGNALAELVHAAVVAADDAPNASTTGGSSRLSSSKKRPRPWSDPQADTVPRVACPSLHLFLQDHLKPRVPVILTGCMEHWPAYQAGGGRAWRDLGYLKRVAGARTVPVEVGKGTYLSAEEGGWGQRLMPLAEFIDRFVVGEGEGGGEKGYLAQHELFEQLPALRKDILVPDYCALEDDDDDDDEGEGAEDEGVADAGDGHVIVNAWFGPAGTVSPAHTDPYHNLLAQVVGAKAVRLFSPEQTPCLYPHRGLMHNNSQVDPKAPDLARFPLFAHARPLHCVLGAGEMLYIPPLWWHHIESLSVSFSVSFWWGRRREMPPPVSEGGDQEDS